MHITQNFLISTTFNCQNKGMDLVQEGCACLFPERLELRNKCVSVYSLLGYSVTFFPCFSFCLYNKTFINLSTIQL